MTAQHSSPTIPHTDIDVAVLGTTLPELAAALDMATLGLSVRVYAPDLSNESVHTVESQHSFTAGATAPANQVALSDLPTTPQLDRDGVLANWLSEVAAPLVTGEAPAFSVDQIPPPRWWVESGEKWFEQPKDAVYGVPSSPLSVEVAQALGTGGALRAYADRVKPVLTIGKTRNVAPLVASRMGKRVLNTFVEPEIIHKYGVTAEDVEVAILAPGLNETITRVGSLSGAALAYHDRYLAQETTVIPSAGWQSMASTLVEKLRLFGAQFVSHEAPLKLVKRVGGEGWQIELHNEVVTAAAIVTSKLPAEFAVDSQVSRDTFFEHSGARAYARFDIEKPEWWPDHQAKHAIRIVRTSDREAWSCAVEVAPTGAVHAELRGPVAQSTKIIGAVQQAELLALAEIQPLSSATIVFKSDVADATTEHGQTALRNLMTAAEEEQPEMIFCPRISFQTGLADAIAVARHRAVEMRRAIVGIA